MDSKINLAVIDDDFINALAKSLMPLLQADWEKRDGLEKYDYDVTAKYLYQNIFKCDPSRFNKIQALPGFPVNPNPGGNPTYNLKEVLIWRHESQQRR